MRGNINRISETKIIFITVIKLASMKLEELAADDNGAAEMAANGDHTVFD